MWWTYQKIVPNKDISITEGQQIVAGSYNVKYRTFAPACSPDEDGRFDIETNVRLQTELPIQRDLCDLAGNPTTSVAGLYPFGYTIGLNECWNRLRSSTSDGLDVKITNSRLPNKPNAQASISYTNLPHIIDGFDERDPFTVTLGTVIKGIIINVNVTAIAGSNAYLKFWLIDNYANELLVVSTTPIVAPGQISVSIGPSLQTKILLTATAKGEIYGTGGAVTFTKSIFGQ